MEPPPSKLKHSYEKKSVRWGEPNKGRSGLHISFNDNVEIINAEEAKEIESPNVSSSSSNSSNVIHVNFGIIKEKYTYVEDFLCPQPAGAEPVRVRGDAGAEERVTIAAVPAEEVASREMACPAGHVWLRATVCAPSSGVVEDTFHVEGSSDCVIVVSGKVMGSGRGTPSLREGVHCVGFNYSLKTDFEDDDDGDDDE